MYRLEVLRGDVDALVGTGERQARRIVSALLEKQVLVSESPRAPLRLAFPAGLAMRWMPGLFPENSRDVSATLAGRPGGLSYCTVTVTFAIFLPYWLVEKRPYVVVAAGVTTTLVPRTGPTCGLTIL